jgi:hypothetical protein
MLYKPSQPLWRARCPSSAVEFTMSRQTPAQWADLLDILRAAANEVFPGPILERLLDRMEART